MALAAFGDPATADPGDRRPIDRIVARTRATTGIPLRRPTSRTRRSTTPASSRRPRRTPRRCSPTGCSRVFANAAREHLPAGIPLYISGGCGLNCDWNAKWRELGHFSSVFVPPCTDDSGLGARHRDRRAGCWRPATRISSGTSTAGASSSGTSTPTRRVWTRRPLDYAALAEAIAGGRMCAWVQGRWEIGPRALGNRSLLAEPFSAGHARPPERDQAARGLPPDRALLPDRGRRQAVRPRLRGSRTCSTSGESCHQDLGAVTHVDGSARVQTVSKDDQPRGSTTCWPPSRRAPASACCATRR